jgi:outer membrane protein
MQVKFRRSALLLGTAVLFASVQAPNAQTLPQSLISAYYSNPVMNAQRAATRATDELVPQALAGYRPTITGNADAGVDRIDNLGDGSSRRRVTSLPRSYGIDLTQNVFNGFQTANRTRSAESQVFGAREQLRNTEQEVLLNAATAYMNVLRDGAIVQLRQQSLEALNEQLRQTRDRFNVGELTRTDVAQAQARVAEAESLLSGANATLNASRAAFRRDIGLEPQKLAPAQPVPFEFKTLDEAMVEAYAKHPAILARRHGVDTASLQVKIAEGALLPSVNVVGSVDRFYGRNAGAFPDGVNASAVVRLTVPIYQGGAEFAKVRETKELLSEQRLRTDVTSESVKATVIQAWGLVGSSRFQVEAAQAQVAAAEIALNGVREEYRVGQRTTLDVLNAQSELVNARVALVTAQRDRVVNSYTLYYAVGRLSIAQLGLVKEAQTYKPEVHYEQVRDSWFGLRTPDGQ